MRISGGRARGLGLKAAPGTRPAGERVRQAVFSSLGADVAGARVLDLYCGGGTYALEALSRGAASATGVDRDHRAIAVARANAASTGLSSAARWIVAPVARFVRSSRSGAFDLVFIDAPYDDDTTEGDLAALGQLLDDGAVVVVERRWAADDPRPVGGYLLVADKRYGDTRTLTYRRTESDQ